MDMGYCSIFFFLHLFKFLSSMPYCFQCVNLLPIWFILLPSISLGFFCCCSSFKSYLLNAVPDIGVGNTTHSSVLGLLWWLSWLRISPQRRRPGFDSWVRKIPWKRERLPTPVFWPGEFHGLWIAHGVTKSQT